MRMAMKNRDCGIDCQQNETQKTLFNFELETDVCQLRRLRSKRFQTDGRIGGHSTVVVVVYEVAARSVRTQSGGVERPTEIGLVLGMPRDRAQLRSTVGELTSHPVATRAALLELSTQFCLVALAVASSTGCVDGTRTSRAAATGNVRVIVISCHLQA